MTLLSMVPESGFSTPAIIFIMVVFPKAFAPTIPSTSLFRTLPASIATEKVEYFFSRDGYSMMFSVVTNSSVDVDASNLNATSLNLTFSFGK